MSVPETTKKLVLERFKALLITTTLSGDGFGIGFTDGASRGAASTSGPTSHLYRTYIVGSRPNSIIGQDKQYCTISMNRGQFVLESMEGAGRNAVPYRPEIVVRLFDSSYRDRRGQKETHFLADDGLFLVEAAILKTVLGSDLPEVGNAATGILIRPILPVDDDVETDAADGSDPEADYQNEAILTIRFTCEFHLSLA